MDIAKIEEPYQCNHAADTITRGWTRPDGVRLSPDTAQYKDVLPTHENHDVVWWIKEKLKTGPVNLLDIGAGTGNFALQMKQLFPEEQLKISIINHPNEIEKLLAPNIESDNANTSWYTKPLLAQAGIEVVHADFLKFDPSILEKFDLIVSCFGITHLLANPFVFDEEKILKNLEIFEKINQLLKQDGIAFIGPVLMNIENNRIKNEIPNLEVVKMPVIGNGVSFKRFN